MKRWPFIVLAIAFVAFVATACAPPPPAACTGPFCYDAANDVVHIDDAYLSIVSEEYGQPGVDWMQAHEDGHQKMMQVWRTEHVALWLLMPGATANIQIEQLAQCLAKAALGHGSPWQWDAAAVAAGYWDCPSELAAEVAS